MSVCIKRQCFILKIEHNNLFMKQQMLCSEDKRKKLQQIIHFINFQKYPLVNVFHV